MSLRRIYFSISLSSGYPR